MKDDVIPADSLDKIEFKLACVMGLGCIGLIGARIYFMHTMIDKMRAVNANDNLVEQVRFFAFRDGRMSYVDEVVLQK